MTDLVFAYTLYLLIAIALTVLVARTLSRHGRPFLAEVFADNAALAESINQLLVVGFYLVSLGFVALWLTTTAPVTTVADVFQVLSVKLGTVALVLGTLHLINVLVFNAIRRRHLAGQDPLPRKAPAPPVPGYPAR
jgi:hypothetical protein